MVGSLVGRLAVAAVIVGATWWLSKREDDRRKKEFVTNEIRKRESYLGHLMPPEELARLIPVAEAMYDTLAQKRRATSAPIKTLR